MTIIVTGGAGFIGSNFIFHILKEYPDYRIVCLDKLTYAGNLSTLAPVMDNPNFRFVKADICDREAVNKLFEEEHPDIVVNFAAECSCGPFYRRSGHLPPDEYYGYRNADGRLPQVRHPALSSGLYRRGLRRPAVGPSRLVLHRGDTDPHSALRTAAPRLPLTCWFWLTTVPTACL